MHRPIDFFHLHAGISNYFHMDENGIKILIYKQDYTFLNSLVKAKSYSAHLAVRNSSLKLTADFIHFVGYLECAEYDLALTNELGNVWSCLTSCSRVKRD